ncbi:MAG: putative toxin-antitoxin system toxin component, PIN family [Mangrovibacterium sp.]
MQRIVIDTNVIVSALIQRSYPYLIVNEAFSNKDIKICISEELLEEYVNVLNREKFKKFPDFEANAQALLVDIVNYALMYSPKTKINVISDKDDNKLLEVSEAANVHFLITGNHNDFTMKRYKTTKIVTPKEYWEEVVMKKK